MRWLVTVSTDVDRGALDAAVSAAKGRLQNLDPVPLGEDEMAVFVDGPEDLPDQLRATSTDVIRVNPDSDPQPY